MLAQTVVQRFRLFAQFVRQQRRVRQIAHGCGQHAQVLLGNTGKPLQTKRVRSGDDAFGIQQRPIDVEELASGHFAVIGHCGQRVDVFVDDVDEFLQLVIGLRPANEAFRKLLERIFLTKMRGEEQHQPQAAVDLAAGLEGWSLLRPALGLLGFRLFGAVAVDLRRNDRGTVGTGGFIGRYELRRSRKAAVECIHSLLWADDGCAGMGKDEHGQIVGIGVRDVEVFAINVNGRGKTTLVNNLHQLVRNGLRAQSRGNGIQTKAGNRSLRHTRRSTGSVLRLV